jgi:CheY-like chemotaxis protein
MSGLQANPEFISLVHKALLNLYNNADLRSTPLIQLLGVASRSNPVMAVQNLLTQEIQALKPHADVPLHANAWRMYRILSYRYLEQLSQKEVATEMLLSIRQVRRLEEEAVAEFAHVLWDKYELAKKMPAHTESSVTAQKELAWLKENYPSETVDFASLVELALQTTRPVLEQFSITIEKILPQDLPPVEGPAAPIRQSILNLILLATNHAQSGKVRLEVGLVEEWLELHIYASIGLEGAALAWEPLQENISETRKLVELVNGRLDVTRNETNGDLTICLACVRASQITVLAIDDNTDALQLMQRFLSGSRYRFIGVSDPEQAVVYAQMNNPSVILLDVMLPGVDGWALLGRLRGHPQTMRIPVIICTFLAQEQLALALGARSFLRKPLNREALLDALNQVVDPSH